MTTHEQSYNQPTLVTEQAYLELLAELELVNATNRKLRRQLQKAEQAAAEAVRAHAKMVDTLTETMRENTALTIERDMWKGRAQRFAHDTNTDSDQSAPDFLRVLFGIETITEAEASAIRKAMARLHHPDAGGDAERMKRWNAVLDRLEQQ